MSAFRKWAAFVVGLYVLQSSILPLMAFHGISPNLMLLLSVSFAFLRGTKHGVLMGFCVGLLQDLATGTFFGVHVFSYMLIGLVCGKFSGQVFKDQLFLPLIASVFATAFHYFVMVGFVFLLGYRFHPMPHMQYMLLPMLCYQFVFSYPVHRLTCWMEKKVVEQK